uniref:Lens fiber major intrinsic protein n=1 Tax=Electrophorus electricus TaxID=8005 RepID=A0A4W4H511_ELEEL
MPCVLRHGHCIALDLWIPIMPFMLPSASVSLRPHSSSRHINPSVTLTCLDTSQLSLPCAVFCMCAQSLGTVGGATALYGGTPGNTRGTMALNTVSKGTRRIKYTHEVFLMQPWICIFAVADERRSGRVGSAALSIAFSVTVDHLMGSKNSYSLPRGMIPARSFSPALLMRNFVNHWVYWVGPMSGGAMCAFCYNFMLFLRIFLCLSEKADDSQRVRISQRPMGSPSSSILKHCINQSIVSQFCFHHSVPPSANT